MENKRDFIKGLSKEELLKAIQKSKGTKGNGLKRADRSVSSFQQSYSQQRQWFMEQFMSGGVYNVVQSYRLKGDMKLDLLKQSILYLVEKHESLRTVFRTIDYVPSQIIKPYEPFEIPCIDLSSIQEESRSRKVDELNSDIAKQPFDLTTGPLYQFTIFKLSDTEHVLSLSLHHIISDGWSFGVIIKEIAETYKALLEGNFKKEELSIQYVDYSEWQRQRIERGDLDGQLAYWTKNLGDAPECIQLPYDYKRGHLQTFEGKTEYFTIEKDTFEQINSYCKQEQGSIYHFMMTAFILMLHSYSLDNEICVGTPVANRNKVELEKLIGLFINTVVVKSSIQKGDSCTQLFHAVKNGCEEAFSNSEIPFDKVVESLNIKRNMEFSPVFQVLYVQTEESMLQVDVPGITVEVVPTSVDTAQFDLSLYATVMKDSIVSGFEYNTGLFRKDTVLQMIQDFTTIIQWMLSNPEMTVQEAVSKIEKRKLVCAVASTFIVEPVMDVMDYWKSQFALPCQLELAPYSQIFQELMEENSLLARCDLGILVLRIEDWVQGKDADTQELSKLLADNVAMFEQLFDGYLKKGHQAILYLCPMSDGAREDKDFCQMIQKLEASLFRKYQSHKNVVLIEGETVAEQFDLTAYNDSFGDKEGHVPYIREYFTAMGTEILRQLLKKSFDIK